MGWRLAHRAGFATGTDIRALRAELALASQHLNAAMARIDELATRDHAFEHAHAELRARVEESERLLAIDAVTRFVRHATLRVEPLVSVVLPTRDRPDRLARAIDSVLAQRYTRWELLVVDDGGIVDSRAVADTSEDPRIRWTRIDHRGACAARNEGLRLAKGELIAYIDDDNVMDPEWLYAVVWAFGEYPASNLLYGAFVIDDVLRVGKTGSGHLPRAFLHPFSRDALRDGNVTDIGAIAHRAGLPEARFDEGLREMGDWDLLVRVTAKHDPLVLPVIACYYMTDAPERLSNGPTHEADLATIRDRARVGGAMSERRSSVVMVAFDAMDPAITEQLVSEGRLPTFRELFKTAARRRVRNPPGLYVGTLWSTFFTGRTAADTGFHCWEEIVPGRYERRLTTPTSIRGRPFWELLSDAGKRVAVLDVPHTRAGAPLNGLQVSEWGAHDRHFGLRTQPPELTQQLVERYGNHAVLGADPFTVREWAPDDYLFRDGPLRTPEEEKALLESLLAGAEMKGRLSADIVADGPWDLFLSVFGEPHSVGHQLWHVHDTSHPRHDPSVREQIGDPIVRLYEMMDRGLAAILERADPHVTLLVLLSHGMGPQYRGGHLLGEVLRVLDRCYRAAPRRSLIARTVGRTWTMSPNWLRSVLRKPLAAMQRARLARLDLPPTREHDTDDERRAQAFFVSPNNFAVGGVRINLAGREAEGQVKPGRELEALCRRLESDLLGLVNVDTGTPVVESVERSDSYYERASLDALPDLFVEWNTEHPIETVWSPRFGMIRGPYTHWRTGDHKPGGLLLARAPGIEPSELPALEIDQLAASIAGELGVALTSGDDVAVPELAAVH